MKAQQRNLNALRAHVSASPLGGEMLESGATGQASEIPNEVKHILWKNSLNPRAPHNNNGIANGS